MDEDRFNISIRTFLKHVGVTSQREIERSVRDALASGKLQSGTTLSVKMTLEADVLALTHVVDGTIDVD